MANRFGDVLRGLGSVLNPKVNAAENARYRDQEAGNRAIELGMINKVIAGVESGAIDPSVLDQVNPGMSQIFRPSPEAQARQIAMKRQVARQEFFQRPAVQEALATGDQKAMGAVFRSYLGAGLADNPISAMDEFRKFATSGQRVLAPGASIADESGSIITTAPDRTRQPKTAWVGVPGGKKQQAVLDDAGNIVRYLGAPIDASGINVYSGSLVPGVDARTGRPVFVQPSGRPDTPPRVVEGVVPPEQAGARTARVAAEKEEATVSSVRNRINQMAAQLQQNSGIVGPAGLARRVGETAAGVVAPGIETPAIDYQNNIRLLLADVRKVVEKDPNLSNQERQNLYETLGGGTFQTPGSALRALSNVLEYVEGKSMTGPNRDRRLETRDQFEAGKVYVDGQGNRAKYIGNGQWEQQ